MKTSIELRWKLKSAKWQLRYLGNDRREWLLLRWREVEQFGEIAIFPTWLEAITWLNKYY